MARRRIRHRLAPITALVVGLGLLTACTSGPAMVTTRFELGRAPAPASMAEAPGATTVVGEGRGALTIDFASVFPEVRRLMATAADVETVRISLFAQPMDPAAPTEVATIGRASIAQGVRTHHFSGLPYATYDVWIEVLDAGGELIGNHVAVVDVADDDPVTVIAPIRLAPTILPAPSPTPRPAATPTPAAPSEDGRVGATISLEEGIPITRMPVVAEVAFAFAGTIFTARHLADGGIAVTHQDAGGQGISRFTADGTKLWTTALADAGGALIEDAAGNLYLRKADTVRKVSGAGQVGWLYEKPSDPIVDARLAADGQLWVAHKTEARRLALDGTVQRSYPGFTELQQLYPTRDGGFWSTDRLGATMPQKRDATGAVVRTLVASTGDYLAGSWVQVDPLDRPWQVVNDGSTAWQVWKYDTSNTPMSWIQVEVNAMGAGGDLYFTKDGEPVVASSVDTPTEPLFYFTQYDASMHHLIGRWLPPNDGVDNLRLLPGPAGPEAVTIEQSGGTVTVTFHGIP